MVGDISFLDMGVGWCCMVVMRDSKEKYCVDPKEEIGEWSW